MTRRLPGISTLIACQNEELLLAASVLSFLRFSDEIIIVDNGSTDRSREIARELAGRYPDRIQFHDCPDIQHLHHNRQFALERSRYQWFVRADADFICYTSGPNDCRNLREHLLSWRMPPVPVIYCVPQPNLYVDFMHTGNEEKIRETRKANPDLNLKNLPVIAAPMARIYRWFPGCRFRRKNRWEGVTEPRWVSRRVTWPMPIWMHAGIKSDLNYFFRSERTNWREQGDFRRYPTLDSYIRSVIGKKYGTEDMADAMATYMESCVYPFLREYDEESMMPYPDLLKAMIGPDTGYHIRERDGRISREYAGPPDIDRLVRVLEGSGRVRNGVTP